MVLHQKMKRKRKEYKKTRPNLPNNRDRQIFNYAIDTEKLNEKRDTIGMRYITMKTVKKREILPVFIIRFSAVRTSGQNLKSVCTLCTVYMQATNKNHFAEK